MVGRVPVTEGSNTVFLTIDDGWAQRPEFTQQFIDAGVPVTFFPVVDAVRQNPDYFRTWLDNGATLGNHTVSHPELSGLGPEGQRAEICGANDQLDEVLGMRPTLFRPPYGVHDATTSGVMAECGMTHIVSWSVEVADGAVQFQVGSHLRPGDVVLMHLTDSFDADFTAILDQVAADGMQVGSLPDHL